MNDPQTSLNALIDYIGILEQMLNVSWSNVDWKKYNLKYNPTMHLYNLQQFINGEREERQKFFRMHNSYCDDNYCYLNVQCPINWAWQDYKEALEIEDQEE